MTARARGTRAGAGSRVWHHFTQMARFDMEPRLVVERASGNRLIATDGREYIDGVASLWANVHGHSHPHIVEAIKSQAERLQHSTLLGISHVPAVTLADRLLSHVPKGLEWCFFSSDGASAVEVSLKMAVQYWGNRGQPQRRRIVALDNAYHGDTLGTCSLGAEGPFRDPYEALLYEPLRVPSPYRYRCRGCEALPSCDLSCVDRLRELLELRAAEVAAVIIEPRVQGAGGMIVAPEGHLAEVRRLCDQYDVLLIADEVATGFGKTGRMFACDLEDIAPDILVMGKGITGGYLPLSATMTTDRVYGAFYDAHVKEKTLFHGHTYGGNPLACAAALASLDIFESEPVLERVRERAAELAGLLQDALGAYPSIGEVRQQGLMAGVELVDDRATKAPPPAEAMAGWRACLAAREKGVFLRPLGDTVVVMPPLSIGRDELSEIVEGLRHGIERVSETSAPVG